MVHDYTISDSQSMMKLVVYPMTRFFDHCTDQFKVFSRFLAMAKVDSGVHMLEMNKHRDRYNLKLKCDRSSLIWYWYFVNFGYGISVFAKFSFSTSVLGTSLPTCLPLSCHSSIH